MAAAVRISNEYERKAVRRFSRGASLGIVAGILGLVLPIALILLATYAPGALVPLGNRLVEATEILAAVGAVMFLFSLLFYRRAFAALRNVDARFWGPSVLCLLGTLGFLLVILSTVLALESSNALAVCLNGSPTRAPTCLLSSSPHAAYFGVAGLVLVWLGGLGIVAGLALAGGRFQQGTWIAGSASYALLLLVVAAPLIAVVLPIRALAYPVLLTPLLILVAPACVAAGCRRLRGR